MPHLETFNARNPPRLRFGDINMDRNIDQLHKLTTSLANTATSKSSSSAKNKLTSVAIGASLYGDVMGAPAHISSYAPEFVRLRIYSVEYTSPGRSDPETRLLHLRAVGNPNGAKGYCANLEPFRPFWLR